MFEGFDETLEATVEVLDGQLGQNTLFSVSANTVQGEDRATGELLTCTGTLLALYNETT